jgi:SRSO17 transposase
MGASPLLRWEREPERWLEPFAARLGRAEQRRWASVYLKGLILPGERKSIEPMAARVAPSEVQQLHHFGSASPWATAPLEEELARQANQLLGGPGAVLVVDDTALVKQGKHSVGVARQYCGQLGKRANCQALVSLTLARGEVPVCIGLRLFLPEAWIEDAERRAKAGVPEGIEGRSKGQIALEEIDRLIAQGVTFGCVLGDAEYGKAAAFRCGLSGRGLPWALGIAPNQKVYPADVTLIHPGPKPAGRPTQEAPRALGQEQRRGAALFRAMPEHAFRTFSWRRGTKGPSRAAFAAVRVRVADGPAMANAQHLPGGEVWLVCERRSTGERKYHLSDLPPDTPLERLAALIKARWACEQAHQQMKEELGLDHLECRSWRALHHHALLTMMAFAFLQHLRLREKSSRSGGRRRATTATEAARRAPPDRGRSDHHPAPLPALPAALRMLPTALNLAE